MPLLEWSPEFVLDVSVMDETHREFVDMLNALAEASDAELLGRLDAFIAHTDAHFAQENAWMVDIMFPPIHCHKGEHDNVMGLLREVRERVAAGQIELGRVLARELPEWFRLHASTMDAALAQVIKAVGYQPERKEAAPTA
ncbi:MAG: hemerythrin domain-containing protein [Burkholderiales bacterium]|jgi:hemerythrin-like metal-binding protein|nr:hemerythrin domain-containing protein [Burkholderiales bacterium]